MLSDLYALISRIDALLNAIDQAMTDISFTSAEIEIFIQRGQAWLDVLNDKIELYQKVGAVYIALFIILFALVVGCFVAITRIEKRLDKIWVYLRDNKSPE